MTIFKTRQKWAGVFAVASHDQPVLRDGDSTLFPRRTTVGFEQRLFDKATLSVSHEIQDGADASSSNTIVGVSAEPWKGARVTVAADKIAQDSGERVGATFGVDQQVRLSEFWSASFGMARRQELSSDGVIDAPDDIVPDAAVSPLEEDREFTSLYPGLAYRAEHATGSARLEMKKSEVGRRYVGVVGAAREESESFSYAGAARYQHEENELTPDRKLLDVRIGAALRPRGDGLIVFDRLDVGFDHADGLQSSWKR